MTLDEILATLDDSARQKAAQEDSDKRKEDWLNRRD